MYRKKLKLAVHSSIIFMNSTIKRSSRYLQTDNLAKSDDLDEIPSFSLASALFAKIKSIFRDINILKFRKFDL